MTLSSTVTVVVVFDAEDSNRAEVAALESPESAERLLESLLEAGYPRERMRVFSGSEVNMAVSYRPVVSLDGETAGGPEPEPADPEDEAEPPVPEAEPESEEPSPAAQSDVFRRDGLPPNGARRSRYSELVDYP